MPSQNPQNPSPQKKVQVLSGAQKNKNPLEFQRVLCVNIDPEMEPNKCGQVLTSKDPSLFSLGLARHHEFPTL